jgi:hypothetical protein
MAEDDYLFDNGYFDAFYDSVRKFPDVFITPFIHHGVYFSDEQFDFVDISYVSFGGHKSLWRKLIYYCLTDTASGR